MNATPMCFQQGDTLSIRDDQGQVALWLVIERKRRGYLLRPQSGSDARTWSDDEIDIVYGARRLAHHRRSQQLSAHGALVVLKVGALRCFVACS